MLDKVDSKKITLRDLIAKKMQSEDSKITFKEIYIKSLDGTLIFKKPSNDDMLDTLDKIGNDENIRNCVEAFKFLIYQCCDVLHSQELHQAYEIVAPSDIVDVLFDLSDILDIGNQLLALAGIDKVDVDKTIKN